MFKAYLSLGSNIAPREKFLQEAQNELENLSITILQRSYIYETPPWGNKAQDAFLNMVLEVQTMLSPFALLESCLQVEKKLGRVRDVRWGPRTIDIDILLYENIVYRCDILTLPHPYMLERGFVLIPLQEIAPDLRLQGKSLAEHIKGIDCSGIKKYISKE